MGLGLVCRRPAPAMPRELPGLPSAIRLRSAPSLQEAGSPCSLLSSQTYWSFSKFSSHWLDLTSVPGREVILVTGLWNMQLVSLMWSVELSPGLWLVSITWIRHLFCEVCDIVFLLNFPRKGWLRKQVSKASPVVAELSCWPSPLLRCRQFLFCWNAYFCFFNFKWNICLQRYLKYENEVDSKRSAKISPPKGNISVNILWVFCYEYTKISNF